MDDVMKGVTWFLHDCGDNIVCMESRKPDWKNFFIGDKHGTEKIEIHYKSNIYDVETDCRFQKKIFCSSCRPSKGDLWHNCKIKSGEEWFYTDEEGFLKTCSDCGDPRWFKWRIVSPPTHDYWRLVTTVDNCAGKTSLPVSQVVRGFVTSVGATSVRQKIEKGLEATAILSMDSENTIKKDWSSTHIRELARGRGVSVGGRGACDYKVQPCHVWRLYQLEGQAGYTTVGTRMVKSEQEEC